MGMASRPSPVPPPSAFREPEAAECKAEFETELADAGNPPTPLARLLSDRPLHAAIALLLAVVAVLALRFR